MGLKGYAILIFWHLFHIRYKLDLDNVFFSTLLELAQVFIIECFMIVLLFIKVFSVREDCTVLSSPNNDFSFSICFNK